MTQLGKGTEEQRRFEAEERAIAYVERFSADVAFATALALEFS